MSTRAEATERSHRETAPAGGRGAVAREQLCVDISEHMEVPVHELRRLSVRTLRKIDSMIYDSLTGALLRPFGIKALEREVKAARQKGGGPLTVLLIDADGLKQTNDTLGYAAGDALLAGIVDALGTVGVPRNRVIRLGGDEFVAILPGTTLEEARALRGRLDATLAEQGRSVSAGSAFLTGRESIDTMLNRAEGQLHAEKRTRPQNREYSGPATA